MKKQTWHTILFISFFLLGGILHVLEDHFHNVKSPDYTIVTILFCMVFLIYCALLIFWIQSVQNRLLPSKARTYLIVMAVMMIFYLFLRAFKYRIASAAVMIRLTWYAYYVPMVMIPTLFLMLCIWIARGEKKAKWDERLLLVPAGILVVTILTNDLHHVVFLPEPGIEPFIGKARTYTYRLPFYLTYAWMILTILIGVALLVKVCGSGKNKRKLLYIAGDGALWLFLIELHKLKKIVEFIPPYESPEIHVFAMLGIFEFCIRERLIPCNENYDGFFAKLPMPVVITDRELNVVCQSANGIEADRQQLSEALKSPIYPLPDQKLSGKEIRGGYAFWVEDESEVRRANEKLLEANELLESENTLIEYENRQKEQNAYYRSRHHIYHEIAEKMYPYQKRIEEMLNAMQPGAEDYRERLARVCVLNAYVKRKTNLLLLQSEKDQIDLRELLLAVSESGRYLSYVGIKASVEEKAPRELCPPGEEPALPSEVIMGLYDGFEILIEQMIGQATLLMVSYELAGLKLAVDAECRMNPKEMPIPVQAKVSDGITYLTLRAEKGGE